MSDLEYRNRLKRARNKREGRDPARLLTIGGGAVITLLLVILGGRIAAGGRLRMDGLHFGAATPSALAAGAESAASPSAVTELTEEEQKERVVDSYQNLGIVLVSGFLNMREAPDKDAKINGKMLGGSACEILDDSTEGWYKVSSGGLTGYISSEFVSRGEEAKEKARQLVQKMAVISTDKLNVRSEPDDSAQVLDQVTRGERYAYAGEENGWIKIPEGYISGQYAVVKYALNEARQMDMRTAVLNMYDHIGISDVDTYLNMRFEPSEDAKIIGKLTSKAAGEIKDKTDDGQWYLIQSGPVTGYVKSEYILTGDAANQEALKNAKLMAIVSEEVVNARTEPNTNAKIWTQISNKERYDVLEQTDGWAKIQLDDDTAYVATDYVDVRYALNEAVVFTPVPETPPEPETQAPAAPGKSSGKKKKSSGSGGSGGAAPAPSGGGSGSGNAVAAYATQFLGNPYVWGGSSLTGGTDCSGFTMSVMRHFGVSLPHHAASQAGMGSAVSSGNMQPGDLVFYSNGGGINHVALYIGNGQVVHASNPRSGIKISSWNYRSPAAIRRVLN